MKKFNKVVFTLSLIIFNVFSAFSGTVVSELKDSTSGVVAPVKSKVLSPTKVDKAVAMMYDHGKLYVVVSVVFIIFIGIVVYLVRLEKKIGDIEKKVKNDKK